MRSPEPQLKHLDADGRATNAMYNPIYDLSNFSVGFVVPSIEDGWCHFVSAGSGTLVNLDGAAGILTAAHVLENLPKEGIQVALFSNRDRYDFVPIQRGPEIIVPGADLGFMSLAPFDVASLGVKKNFKDIGRELETRSGFSEQYAVCGAVDEWTETKRSSDRHQRRFIMLGTAATIIGGRAEGDFDIVEVKPKFSESYEAPSRYSGASGSALWRVYVGSGGREDVKERRIVGVAYRDDQRSDGSMQISYYGERTIYEQLLPLVRAELAR